MLDPESRVAEIYGALEVKEHYYCNFGLNPSVVQLVTKGPMQVVGSDNGGEIRVLELPNHPFFVATLFVPQARSRADHPHPLVTAFIKGLVSEPGTLQERHSAEAW